MGVVPDINKKLKRVFRSYNAEEGGKELSDWRKRQLAVDEADAFRHTERQNAVEERKDKRAVRVVRTDRKTGKSVTFESGIFAVRDHGTPEAKLRKAFGGKVAKRILKAELRAARERPFEVTVDAIDEEGGRHSLVRGVDFAIVPKSHGGPTLVLHDAATEFEAKYEPGFADRLASA